MWPWSQHRRDVEAANREAAEASRRKRDSEAGLRSAERLAEQSRSVSAAWRRQVDLNGFTELLQQAMGRREA